MFNLNVKMKFVELKSLGMPMYKIANELGVHRATLMRWNKELAPYILVAKEDMINEMLFENGCMRLNRVQKISKHLAMYYEMLDESQTDKEYSPSGIIEMISKLTKLLLQEMNAKTAESYLKTDTDALEGLKGLEGDEDWDSTVWVTDKEKFTRYEPDDDILNMPKDEMKELAKDIAKKGIENAGFINSSPETLQDISEKPEEIQKIFKKTIGRAHSDAYSEKKDKCNNNVTMKAADYKVKNKKKAER